MTNGNSIEKLHIYRALNPNGISISFLRKNYDIIYPLSVWKDFPSEFRQNFADALTYFLTMHLTLVNGEKTKIIYHFPPPVIEPFFFKGMLYSMGENALIMEDKQFSTSELIKFFYNRYVNINFASRPRYARFKNVNRNLKNRAIIPFSFGKDSLLTFALTKEIGITPYLIFFREPHCAWENRHKARLIERFFSEFDLDVNVFPLSAGWLRQSDSYGWGWDLLLTQYTLLLIPFLFSQRAKYLFWAHEQSCNDTFIDKDGFINVPAAVFVFMSLVVIVVAGIAGFVDAYFGDDK